MSLRIFVDGKREDVERFYKEILYPDFGRLRDADLFRVTENDMQYRGRKTKEAVERRLRGYCPTQRWKNGSEHFGKYEIERGEPKRLGHDIERVTDVQVKIGLLGLHFEVNMFFEEVIRPKSDRFIIEKDTGIYTNFKGYASRQFGGHFNDPDVQKTY